MKLKMHAVPAMMLAFALTFSLTDFPVSADTTALDASAQTLSGDTSAEQEVYDFATCTMGLNTAAACGIMGNAKCENSFGTGWDDPDSGSFFGLFQWPADGYENLAAWCRANGKDPATVNGQMSFMYHELTTDYPSVWNLLKNTPDTAAGASNAGYRFSTDYEQPGDDDFSALCGSTAASYFPKYSQAVSADAPAAVRLCGSNRYDTAAAIMRKAFSSAKTAVLVSGEKFPDALSAGGLAGSLKAPLLITACASLSSSTRQLILDLGITHIVIIGGADSVSEAVETQLAACGVTDVQRISGRNRYETAEQVYLQNTAVFDANPRDACVITTGSTPADALSVSPWTYAYGMPVLLAAGGTLSEQAKEIADHFGTVYVLGNENAVSTETSVSLSGKVIRLAGKNRYETCTAIAKEFADSFNNTAIASGADACFPDSLVGGVLQGKNKAPLLLLDGGSSGKSSAVYAYLKNTCVPDDSVKNLYVFGGTASVPDGTVKAVRLLW
jgi:putative cell wall-binding protein